MRDFTKRASPRQHILRFFVGVGGVLVLSFITFEAAQAAWGMYGKFAEAAKSDEEAQHNLSELNAQVAGVSATVHALSSERGQEAQLRQSYGVALPGEGEIQIVAQTASGTPAVAPKQGFWARMLKALFVW